MSCKTFETLIKTMYMPVYTAERPHLINFFLLAVYRKI